jgi:hypothetical protein
VSWQIQIPHRHRSDSLSEVAEAACELPTDEERAVVRRLVLGEIVGGSATTAGELLDKLEKTTPEQRRKMLDDARVKAGLPSASQVELRDRFERDQIAGAVKSANETRPLRLALSPSGAIVDLNDADDERARSEAEAESRRHIREHRDADAAVEAAQSRESRRLRDEAHRRELPPGVGP